MKPVCKQNKTNGDCHKVMVDPKNLGVCSQLTLQIGMYIIPKSDDFCDYHLRLAANADNSISQSQDDNSSKSVKIVLLETFRLTYPASVNFEIGFGVAFDSWLIT